MSVRTDRTRAFFTAYAAADREAVEALLADDFHFTSPYDNRLDRAAYFDICWPPPAETGEFEVVRMAEEGDTVFITYVGHLGGDHGVRNTEALSFDGDDRVTEVEVYFGWNVPHPVAEGEHKVS